MDGGPPLGGLPPPPPTGRLTPDLILRAPQFMNCLGDYEIDLRGALFFGAAGGDRSAQLALALALTLSSSSPFPHQATRWPPSRTWE